MGKCRSRCQCRNYGCESDSKRFAGCVIRQQLSASIVCGEPGAYRSKEMSEVDTVLIIGGSERDTESLAIHDFGLEHKMRTCVRA